MAVCDYSEHESHEFHGLKVKNLRMMQEGNRMERINRKEPKLQTIIKQWEPQEDSMLYYYCSANSFMAIVKNKTLRFCDLYHMNDLSELRHGKLIYDQIIKESKEFSDDIKRKIDVILTEFINRCVLLSMSFSQEKRFMPIKEVIIGPKNRSTKLDIELFLRTNGIQGAIVSESLSSYR